MGKHQRIVHHTDPGLDIISCVTRKCSPCRGSQHKASTSPVVNAHSPIVKISDSTLNSSGHSRNLERCWVYKQCHIQCPPDSLVGEIHSAIDIVRRCVGYERRLSKETTECLYIETEIIPLIGINIADQGPWKLPPARHSKLL